MITKKNKKNDRLIITKTKDYVLLDVFIDGTGCIFKIKRSGLINDLMELE